MVCPADNHPALSWGSLAPRDANPASQHLRGWLTLGAPSLAPRIWKQGPRSCLRLTWTRSPWWRSPRRMWTAWPSTPSPSSLQPTSRNRPATRTSGGPSDTRCSTMRTMPTARYPGFWWLGPPPGPEGSLWRKTVSPLSLFPQAALAVWCIILRFMGDLPEPVLLARNDPCGSSVAQQLQDTLGGENGTQSAQQRGSTQVPGARGWGRADPRGPPWKLDPRGARCGVSVSHE